MLYVGKANIKNEEMVITIVESTLNKRTDFFKLDVEDYKAPMSNEVICSVLEDLTEGTKVYYGNIDIYNDYETMMKTSRRHNFKANERDEVNDFEEGKVIYELKQKSGDIEYNYRTENSAYINRRMASSLGWIEYSLVDKKFSTAQQHMTISYKDYSLSTEWFDGDAMILSKIATVSELRQKFDLTWLDGKDYRWMESIQMLKEHLLELKFELKKNPDLMVAIDTETTGLDMYYYPHAEEKKDKIVSIVISWKKDFAIYIPIRHKYEQNLDEKEVMKLLIPFIKNVKFVTQNGGYDYRTFLEYLTEKHGDYYRNLKLRIKADLLLINYILQPNVKKGSRALKDNVAQVLGIKQLSLHDLFPPTKEGKGDIRFELLNKELALIYACPDVDLLLELVEIKSAQMPKKCYSIFEIENELMPIVSDSEYYGLRVDMKTFEKEKILCEAVVDQLREAIYVEAGFKFNINSPDQVGNLLYNKLGCEILISSKTTPGKGSTSSKALKNLAKLKVKDTGKFKSDLVLTYYDKDTDEEHSRTILTAEELNKAKYPVIVLIQAFRNYEKLLSSFFNPIEENNKGGRLISWINQTGAQTGRIISPLQTLPPFIKNMIVPDTDEHGWLIFDYKQIELRLMFGLAKETEMIRKSTNPFYDIHRIVAAGLHGKEIWEVDGKLRKASKGLNFGIPYALGDASLGETLFGIATNAEDKAKNLEGAKKAKRDYLNLMPRVERLFIDVKEEVRQTGKIFTLFGRMYDHSHILTETNNGVIARTLRQVGNANIQGLGADILKYGTVMLNRKIREKGWDVLKDVYDEKGNFQGRYPLVRPCFYVHDEVGISYHKKSINPLQVARIIKDTMQIDIKDFPPLFVGCAVVDNWGQAKDDAYEIPQPLLLKWCDEVDQGMHTEPLEDPRGWVLSEIEKYNEVRFEESFMELKNKLIKEGKPLTVDSFAENFRDDVLVHDIVGYYKDSKFEELYGHKPSHVEKIEWSVKMYLKDYNIFEKIGIKETVDNETAEIIYISEDFMDVDSMLGGLGEVKEDGTNDKQEDIEKEIYLSGGLTEDSDEFERMERMELLDELDDYGNPHDTDIDYEFSDDIDDVEEPTYNEVYGTVEVTEEEYLRRKQEIDSTFSKKVMFMERKIFLNTNLVADEVLDVLVEMLKDNHRDDGLYEVWFDNGGHLIESPFKVDKIDVTLFDLLLTKSAEEFNKLMKKE